MSVPPRATSAIDPAWAWAPYGPDAQRPWNLERAGHLYRRAAFGATWDELQRALADGPEITVSRLLKPHGDLADFERAHAAYEDAAARSNAPDAFVAWWLRRLLETPHPLLEQMTLCWHNHFALSNAAVNSTALMNRYLRGLRRDALGRFDTMLEGVLAEPALFLCLDGRANRKARPNQHLPRGLMEQYTLGPGVASPQDIREAARAFTGWFVVHDQLQFLAHEHDGGMKKLLGQEGAFGTKDVSRLLLGQPATARWLVARLYRWLISETEPPSAGLLDPLAAEFARGFNIAVLVETMLRSNLFFSPIACQQKVKSPVEFMLSLVKPLEGSIGTLRLGGDLAALGQDLLEPPTTKGWAGRHHWLNGFTILGRSSLAQVLLTTGGPHASHLDPAALAASHGHQSVDSAGEFFCQLFCQASLPEAVRQKTVASAFAATPGAPGELSKALRRLVGLLAVQPEFQLA